MKCKHTGKPDGRELLRVPEWMVICTFLLIVACILLLPLFAMAKLGDLFGDVFGNLLVGFMGFALAVWLIIDEVWLDFAWLLLSLLGWLLLDYPLQP